MDLPYTCDRPVVYLPCTPSRCATLGVGADAAPKTRTAGKSVAERTPLSARADSRRLEPRREARSPRCLALSEREQDSGEVHGLHSLRSVTCPEGADPSGLVNRTRF
jgi:hypothetical protein